MALPLFNWTPLENSINLYQYLYQYLYTYRISLPGLRPSECLALASAYLFSTWRYLLPLFH